jgi:hypothetical protein
VGEAQARLCANANEDGIVRADVTLEHPSLQCVRP